MRAIRVHQHGGAEVLRWEEATDPAAGEGEALVRVRACALNHLDLFIRQGIPGVTIGLPRVLGCDIAGEVVRGAGWEAGARVMLAPGSGCGHCHFCLDGRDNECRQYAMLGYQRDGGYAELVSVPAKSLLPLRGELGWAQAASFPLVFLTAWNMLVRRAAATPGQTVLVWAASSGVGIAAVQIAKLLGCRVLATAGSAAKRERALQLGADAVADHYDTEHPVSQVAKQWAPGGVDVVIEHVGEASWEQSLRALAPNGVLVTCGATTGYRAGLDLRFLFARQLRLLGSYMGRRADLDILVQLLGEGKLKPVVDRVFPLAEAASAHRYLEGKQQFGKVVLEV